MKEPGRGWGGEFVVARSGWWKLDRRAHWFPSKAREAAAARSGVYALRYRPTGQIIYVGASESDRLWKTMLRHLHARKSFEQRNEWVGRVQDGGRGGPWQDAEKFEVFFWITLPEHARLVEAWKQLDLRPAWDAAEWDVREPQILEAIEENQPSRGQEEVPF